MDFSITGVHFSKGGSDFSESMLIELVRAGLLDSGVTPGQDACPDFGFFLGSTFSNYSIRQFNTSIYRAKGVRALNPADFPKCLISYLGGCVCASLRIQGVNSTVSSGKSSGIDALTQGLYFLRRNSANKAAIVELDETVTVQGSTILTGVCLVIENARQLKKSYADIVGVESFFEKKGQADGLVRAAGSLARKIPKGLPVENIACSSRLKKHIQSLKTLHSRVAEVSKITYSESGGLHSIAENLDLTKNSGKRRVESTAMMFLNLGEDTNSNCVAVIREKKENSRERKKQ